MPKAVSLLYFHIPLDISDMHASEDVEFIFMGCYIIDNNFAIGCLFHVEIESVFIYMLFLRKIMYKYTVYMRLSMDV